MTQRRVHGWSIRGGNALTACMPAAGQMRVSVKRQRLADPAAAHRHMREQLPRRSARERVVIEAAACRSAPTRLEDRRSILARQPRGSASRVARPWPFPSEAEAPPNGANFRRPNAFRKYRRPRLFAQLDHSGTSPPNGANFRNLNAGRKYERPDLTIRRLASPPSSRSEIARIRCRSA